MSYVPFVYPLAGGTPPPALDVRTTTLPSGTEDVLYPNVSLVATGGTAPYSWAVLSGALPSGMSLSSAGVLSGTPTAAGSFEFVVRVTDAVSATDDSGTLSLVIASAPGSALAVTTTSLPSGDRGVTYPNRTLSATGGTAPYTWTVASGSLPTGLSLSSGGVLSGVPTVAGTSAFVVRATDAASATADSGTLTVVVNQVAALAISTPSALPRGRVSSAYTRSMASTGGWGAKTWTKLSGSYPAGVTMNSAGVFSGTPTTEETAVFVLQVTDSESRTASGTFSLTIDPAATGEGPHDFFNEQTNTALHPECIKSESMRSTESLDRLLVDWPSRIWSYVFGTAGETNPAAPDAARCIMPHSLAGGDQPKIDLKPFNLSTGSFLAMVETMWMRECLDDVIPQSGLTHKWQQFEGKKVKGEQIHIEPRINFRPDTVAGEVGHLDLRPYGTTTLRQDPTTGVITDVPMAPTGPGAVGVEGWHIRPDVMVRDYFLFELNEPGTNFPEWTSTYTGGAPLVTVSILGVAIDGADTVLTIPPGNVPAQKASDPDMNIWVDSFTEPEGCRVTITGNDNPVLNGTFDVVADDYSHLRIRGLAVTGSGGQVSKHFTKFTWVHAEEDIDPFFVYFKVPLCRFYNGLISVWRQEYNTSKDIDTLVGFNITAAPTQASPTVLTIGAHTIETGDYVWISGSDVIPQQSYVATYVSPTQISIPLSVTTESAINPGPRPAIDQLNFGDIGAGDTFTLQFREDISAPVTYSDDMTADLRAAFDALPNQPTPTVVRVSASVYTITVNTTRSNTVQVNATGFTYGGTTRIQTAVGQTFYGGTYGLVSKPLVIYTRNMILQRNREIDFNDTTLFKRPIR